MFHRNGVLIGCLLLAGVRAASAQTAPRLDLAVLYTSQRSHNASSQQNFWSTGGSMEVGVDAWRGWGIAANVTGVHTGSNGSSGVPLSMVTTTFGPRYRWHNGHPASAFGEVLLGEANAFRSLFPSPSGAIASANSLAVQAGGGVDVKLSRHFGVRADARWLRTQLPNGTDNRQDSLQMGGGLVIRFGR